MTDGRALVWSGDFRESGGGSLPQECPSVRSLAILSHSPWWSRARGQLQRGPFWGVSWDSSRSASCSCSRDRDVRVLAPAPQAGVAGVRRARDVSHRAAPLQGSPSPWGAFQPAAAASFLPPEVVVDTVCRGFRIFCAPGWTAVNADSEHLCPPPHNVIVEAAATMFPFRCISAAAVRRLPLGSRTNAHTLCGWLSVDPWKSCHHVGQLDSLSWLCGVTGAPDGAT